MFKRILIKRVKTQQYYSFSSPEESGEANLPNAKKEKKEEVCQKPQCLIYAHFSVSKQFWLL